MNNKKELFLIDAFPIIYQSYYAYIKNPLFTSFGLNTSPIVNFTNFLIKILNEKNPSYMGVIFDGGKKNFRNKKYKKYKKNRKKTPIEIILSIPYIIKILKAFKILYINSNNGYEADDIIGTIANKAENCGYTVYIISLDKDFLQLITKNIKVYLPPFRGKKSKILEIDDIRKKFDVEHPKQLIDLWSMMGDSSDNIPGLPGIGEKNAKKFIKKYGTIEKLLNSVDSDNFNKNIKKKIETNKDIGFLSKQLVTIVTNIPNIKFNENEFFLKNPNFFSIKNIFKELEFFTLFKKAYRYYKKKKN
ncbi:5'-3' exonuclease [Blattabacterium cuenoti]|uniref:5'-3' exonuclease n=1 Tax=Blattabacterium cuenoti TaxID=1653831 RepID=UPI00163C1D25|nr:5'-3' exonuclease H3TH domain-containing protein [Blattabacterium cuenoti]